MSNFVVKCYKDRCLIFWRYHNPEWRPEMEKKPVVRDAELRQRSAHVIARRYERTQL